MAYTLINPGDPIHASQIDQVINSLIGTAGAGQVLSFSALNDATHYALTVQNLDGTNSNGLQVLSSSGTPILLARGSGVSVSALTVSGLTAFAGGVQIGPNTNALLRPMPNDANSLLLQSSNWVNVAGLAANGPMLSSDAYYDGTGWQRGTSTSAIPTLMNCGNGAFGWYTVPAGSGAMPAWTQRMGLDGSGNLTLQTGGLTVAGAVAAQSTLTVSSTLTANGGLTVNGTLTGNGATNINGLSCTTINTNGQQITAGPIASGAITCTTVNTQGNTISAGAVNASGAVTGAGISSSSQVYSTTTGSLYLRGADGNVHIDTGGGTLFASAGTFTGNVTVQNSGNNVVPFTVGGTYEHIEHGFVNFTSIGNNSGSSQTQTFTRAFNTTPIVIATIDTMTTGDIKDWHVAAQSRNNANFSLRIYNTSGSTGNCGACWFAMGN